MVNAVANAIGIDLDAGERVPSTLERVDQPLQRERHGKVRDLAGGRHAEVEGRRGLRRGEA